MEFHPAVFRFPEMDAESFAGLKADIAENGVLQPVVLFDGRVIDGRHRWKACQELGRECPTTDFEGSEADALRFVVSSNLHRRHLTASQKACVAVELLEPFAAEAKERQGTRTDIVAKMPQCSGEKARNQAAEVVGVSPRYVQDAKKLKTESPDVFEQVSRGELTLPQAITSVRHSEKVAELRKLEVEEIEKPTGVFDVIVIDPPWAMQKIEREVAPNQTAFDYPTMSQEELLHLEIPAADNCHVWLWTTQKFLPDALELLWAWKLKYVCTFVWHKPGGFQPFSLPQYNCEFAIYATKGSPVFVETKAFFTCFNAPRGKHSEKPEEFYDVVRRVTAGRRLDMFNRRKIEGFTGWGKEAAK